MKARGLKTKMADIDQFRSKKVEYFRGDQFEEVAANNIPDILEIFSDYNLELKNQNQIYGFFQLLIRNGLLLRLDKPIGSKKVWPKNLNISAQQTFGHKMFYTWTIGRTPSNSLRFVFFMGIMLAIAFPMLPARYKLIIFQISGLFLLAMVIFSQKTKLGWLDIRAACDPWSHSDFWV